MDIIAIKGSIIRCSNQYCRTDISVMVDTIVSHDTTNEVFRLSDLATETVYAEIPDTEFDTISGNTRVEI